MSPERDATLHGGGAEQVVGRRLEVVLLDGVFLGELARATQESEHTAADGPDETFDVGVVDRGDRMEVRTAEPQAKDPSTQRPW